jgi:hypothetical protein
MRLALLPQSYPLLLAAARGCLTGTGDSLGAAIMAPAAQPASGAFHMSCRARLFSIRHSQPLYTMPMTAKPLA